MSKQKQILCCMCWKPAEYYTEIGSPPVREYLCRYCAQINNQIMKEKPK